MHRICQSFNRTAYGIEIIKIIACKVYRLSFNRTAYGIEMNVLRQMRNQLDRLLIAPLMELKF